MLNVYKFYLLEKLPKPCDLSDGAAAMAWYSASTLDLATVFCFLLLQEIKFPPMSIRVTNNFSIGCLHTTIHYRCILDISKCVHYIIPMIINLFFHKLTKHTDCKSDVGSSDNKIIQFVHQKMLSSQVFQWQPLTREKLHISSIGVSLGRQSCIPQLRDTEHTFVGKWQCLRRIGKLQSLKVFERTHVLSSLKLTMEMRFKAKNSLRIIASNDNVINIDNKIDAMTKWKMDEKHWQIRLTMGHAKLEKGRAKATKACMRRLLQTIERRWSQHTNQVLP